MGLEVNCYDLKARHPLGPVSQNQNCVFIVKFVYFDIKNRILWQNFWCQKNILKNLVSSSNFHPNMAKPNSGRAEIVVTISKDTAEEQEVVEEEIIPEENANTQK